MQSRIYFNKKQEKNKNVHVTIPKGLWNIYLVQERASYLKLLKPFCILRYERVYNPADSSSVPGFLQGKSVAVPRTQILTLSTRESVESNGPVPLL